MDLREPIEGPEGRARFGRRPLRRIGWACLAPGLLLACASGPFAVTTRDGRTVLTHRSLGYQIAEPPFATAPGWTAVALEEADLAYRDGRGSATSLASSCPRTHATVATLARHVTIGTRRSDVVAAGPFALGRAQGWTQTFDTVEDDVTIRVKAVTLLASGCIYDWLLVSRGEEAFAVLEPAFDAWIDSFVPPPDEATEGPVEAVPATTGGDGVEEAPAGPDRADAAEEDA